MAQISRQVRKLRRVRRERTIALRMADLALAQRDQARAFANLLAKELDKLQNPEPHSLIEDPGPKPDEPTDDDLMEPEKVDNV